MRTSSASVAAVMIITIAGQSLLAEDRISITPRARPKTSAVPSANVRIDVQLLQIPVIVTDSSGQPLTDLKQNAFRVFEDDVERPITAFLITETPVSAGLVFDSSRSMRGRMGEARAAIEQFLNMSLPGDEFSLIRFSTSPELMVPMTEDVAEISRRLSSLEPGGWTSLFDAIALAIHQVRTVRNERKALIVFSDGGDNNSRYSESELISMLREANVQIYTVSMFERSRSLERIAQETGGRAVWLRKLENLGNAMETISRQIRSTYLIGCIPARTTIDGKYHRIRVEVDSSTGPVNVSWRQGYIAAVTSEGQRSLE